MVRHPADLQGGAVDLVERAREIGVEFVLEGGGKKRLAILGAEDEMNEDA
jgi:hypothetical protein